MTTPEQHQAAQARYRATHPHAARDYFRANPDKAKEYRRRSRLKDIESGKKAEYDRRDWETGAKYARKSVQRALRSGLLQKEPCRVCGTPRVEAHHYLGYAPEHRRDVWWLCKQHHEDTHHMEVVS